MSDDALRLPVRPGNLSGRKAGTNALAPSQSRRTGSRRWSGRSSLRCAGTRAPPFVLGANCGAIEPRWHCAGRHAALGRRQGDYPARRPAAGRAAIFRLAYFADAARAASSALVESGKLAAGELFEYLVCAYACRDQAAAPGPERPAMFTIKPVEQVLDVSDLDMDGFLAASSPCGSIRRRSRSPCSCRER